MKDGIYFVRFSRDLQDFGEGIAVIQNNTVNGGDYVCTYKGKAASNKLDLHVTQHNPSVETIFGNIQDFILQLNIIPSEDGYQLSGTVKDNNNLQVAVSVRYLGEVLSF